MAYEVPFGFILKEEGMVVNDLDFVYLSY